MKILLVEDDPVIIRHLTTLLTEANYEVVAVPGQTSALEALRKKAFDLALLDVTLKDGNGFGVCSAIRTDYNIPVIFLTAAGDEFSTIAGLELGAEDYIAKPFRPRELLVRIKKALAQTSANQSVFQLGDVIVDTNKGAAFRNGQDLFLSALEYRLLLVFINHRGQLVERNQILDELWDEAGEYVNDNTLSVYVKRLREKIEIDSTNPQIIQTVRGQGYKVM